jgi:hypothetical protein
MRAPSSRRPAASDTSRSTIITTNLAFKQGGNMFPGAACIAALIDRFNQHCHNVAITADSWREAHPFDHDHQPTTPPKRPRRRKR